MERAGKSPWLFPSAVDGLPTRPRSATRAVIRFRESLGLGDVGTHDLRRTLATGLGDMSVAEEVIERILNHAARTVVGRHYNHAQYRHQCDERWTLGPIASKPSWKVVLLPRMSFHFEPPESEPWAAVS